MIIDRGLLLEHLARLAAAVTGTSLAMIRVMGERKEHGARSAAVGLSPGQSATVLDLERLLRTGPELTVIPDLMQDDRLAGRAAVFASGPSRKLIYLKLISSGHEQVGFICLIDDVARADLTAAQVASLSHIAGIVIADRQREQRHLHLVHVADRALRIDSMLHLVSEAESCAEALSRVLEALCHFHGASTGQIYQLIRPDNPLLEISRYDGNRAADAEPQAGGLQAALGTLAMDAIRRNKPSAIDLSQRDAPEAAASLAAGGMVCYVCVPIWVHQQRFGIALAFAAEKSELNLVVADIASLGDTIRPALLQKVTEERMRFAAYHDDLTRLSNRLMFQERLGSAIATARSSQQSFAVLCLDLDGFKLANDTYGHGFGDNLLVCVAQRLREIAEGSDTIARMGGDEFAVIQLGASQPAEATALAQRLLDAISQPFELAGQRVVIGVSIGVALYPAHGESPDLLLRSADQALYCAKKSGRNTYNLYDPAMEAGQQELLRIENDLKEAISRGQLAMAYQPICDVESSCVIGFEALLRWYHPTLGAIEPDKFIPIAEKSGLIVPLGKWVLETACADAAAWDRPATLSVNLSPLQFRQPDLPRQIADVLRRTGLAPERLKLEVTEGLLLDESDLVLKTMQALHAQGIRVVLDDFGTAYAGISYLRRFPFDGIKIDKCFVRGLHDDKITQAIVEAILSLADRLDLAVVAEGVETERELNVLRRLGCRLIQGYLVGRPAGAAEAHALLRQAWAGNAEIETAAVRAWRPVEPQRAVTLDPVETLADVLAAPPYRALEPAHRPPRERRSEPRPNYSRFATDPAAFPVQLAD